jgi:hypothetical protein
MDLIIKSNAKPYINAEIFFGSVPSVFRHNRAEFRRLDELAEEMAEFLMDHSPSQITSDVIALLTEAQVRVITFAPHPTHDTRHATHNSDLSNP